MRSANPAIAFFDVDGTLTYRAPDAEPTDIPRPRVVDALERFLGAGNLAVVCTGRGMAGIETLRRTLPFSGFVTLDGAHVELDGKVLVDRELGPELLRRTVAEVRDIGATLLFQGTYGCMVAGAVEQAGVSNPYVGIPAFGEYQSLGLPASFGKMDFVQADLDAIRSSAFLCEHFDYYDVGDGYHELALPGSSKGRGAQAILAALPFEPSGVYAFGDSENDISVLEAAEVAVAMGNATDAIKAHASYVCPPAAEDGVAVALEHLGLI